MESQPLEGDSRRDASEAFEEAERVPSLLDGSFHNFREQPSGSETR